MRKSKLIVSFLLRAAATLVAAVCVCHIADAETLLSLPSGTVKGCLPNGLHYIILNNDIPSGRVEFRLVMRVGSLNETPEERGSAHFIEHLAFGNTRHFPKREAVEYIESQGVKFGEGINAYTGYDRTVYMFTLPSATETAVDTGFLIMKDWIDGIKISSRNVEKEKGIICEEIRAYYVGDDFYPLKIGNGIHSKGFPIGTSDEVERLAPRTLRKFYRRCYDASKATVMVVGDVSPKEIERKIISLFSSLKGNKTASKISEEVPLYYSSGGHLMEVRDTILRRTSLDLMIPHPTIVQRTVEDAVLKEKLRLLIAALSERFRSCGIRADVSDRWYLADKDHFSLSFKASSREELLKNVSDVAGVLSSIVRSGFDEEELKTIRSVFCSKLLNNNVDMEGMPSFDICETFTDYAVTGDLYVCDTEQNRLIAEEVAKTDGTFLQNKLAEYIDFSRKTLLAACSSHPGLGDPLSEEEIFSTWENGLSIEREGYEYIRKEEEDFTENAVSFETPLFLSEKHPFERSMISSSKKYPEIGVCDITLSNGIRLLLKPTIEADSTLYVSSFSSFGNISKIDSSLIGYLGYMDGGIEKTGEEELSEYMYNNGLAINMTVENHWYGFMATAPAEKSLELFNLLYEKSFAPAMPVGVDFSDENEEGEEGMLSKMLKRDVSRQISSRTAFIVGDMQTFPHTDKESLTETKLYEFYRKLYSETNGMTYIVCGNFDEDKLTEDFVSVFGKAESKGLSWPETSGSERFDFRVENRVELFRSDNPTRSDFSCLFLGRYKPSLKNSLTLKIMRDLMRNRLISELREKDALVYSPYVSLFYEGLPYGKFHFVIEASADSRNMNLIDKKLKSIMRTLCREEVSERELQTIKKSFLIAKRETLLENSPSAWRETLSSIVKNGEKIGDFDRYEEILSSITPYEVMKAFDEWIVKESSVLLVSQESSVLNIDDYE